MTDSLHRDPEPLAVPLLDLLRVFHDELPDVHFPDVDADVLAEQAASVRADHSDVLRLERELAAARQRLDEHHDALLVKATRALGYARVYAEDNPGLLGRLDVIVLPRPRPKAIVGLVVASSNAPRRRGRPPRALDATLFSGASSPTTPLAREGESREDVEDGVREGVVVALAEVARETEPTQDPVQESAADVRESTPVAADRVVRTSTSTARLTVVSARQRRPMPESVVVSLPELDDRAAAVDGAPDDANETEAAE